MGIRIHAGTLLRAALTTLVALGETLLLLRLLAHLLAARPDNPAVALLNRATAPLVAPLAFLDVGQPRFGAVLELSTLTLVLLLVGIGYVAWKAGMAGGARRTARPRT